MLAEEATRKLGAKCQSVVFNATSKGEMYGLLRRRREIDHPALAIHIREAVGKRDWGRFLERIALPKPAVFMAPNATDEDRRAYVSAAEQVEDGMVSVWPSGGAITDFMGASRGPAPFSALDRAKRPTALETAQLAATLRTAGYAVDRDEIEEAVGFSLSEAEVAQPSSPLALAKATAAQTPPESVGCDDPIAPKKPGDAQTKPDLAQTLDAALYAAMAAAIEEELDKGKEDHR